jgi:hypothetical protein
LGSIFPKIGLTIEYIIQSYQIHLCLLFSFFGFLDDPFRTSYILSTMTSKYVSRHISCMRCLMKENTCTKFLIQHNFWINSIIRNNKCIFTKLNAVCILENDPISHGCTIANVNITINKTLSLENFRRNGVTPRFCSHIVNIWMIEIVLQACCFAMWYINVILIKLIQFTAYEIVLN